MEGPSATTEANVAEATTADAAKQEEQLKVTTEVLGYGFLWQQLLEELGQAKSTEPEENAALVQELNRLKNDLDATRETVERLQRGYEELSGVLHEFSECLYQLAIADSEAGPELYGQMVRLGQGGKKVAAAQKDALLGTKEVAGDAVRNKLKRGLVEIIDALNSSEKVLADARDTKELYRRARLNFDSAERNLGAAHKSQAAEAVLNAAQAERDAAHAKYIAAADSLRAKVMLLHQHRIRSLRAQLKSLQGLFSEFVAQAEDAFDKTDNVKTSGSVVGNDAEGVKTKALTAVLEKTSAKK